MHAQLWAEAEHLPAWGPALLLRGRQPFAAESRPGDSVSLYRVKGTGDLPGAGPLEWRVLGSFHGPLQVHSLLFAALLCAQKADLCGCIIGDIRQVAEPLCASDSLSMVTLLHSIDLFASHLPRMLKERTLLYPLRACLSPKYMGNKGSRVGKKMTDDHVIWSYSLHWGHMLWALSLLSFGKSWPVQPNSQVLILQS